MTSLQPLDFLHRLGGPIVVTNFEGLILHWSPAASELLGFSAEEMHLHCWWEHLHPAFRDRVTSALEGQKANIMYAGVSSVMKKDGTVVNLLLHVSVLYDAERQPQALLTMFHPAPCDPVPAGRPSGLQETPTSEETREAAYQARKTKAINALAGGLAHDFNNIFAATLSYLELLQLAPDLPASMQRYVMPAKTSAARAAELVGRLLSFSRLARPCLEPVRIGSLLDEAFARVHRALHSGIEVRPPAILQELWMVNGDAGQLMQLITNLCLNARDAMPKGGTISVELANVTFPAGCPAPKHPGEFVRLSIGDTGKGISPEVSSRLFEENFTTKEFGKGTALGLAISNTIACEHGGWMEVESEMGKGSRFHTYFPRFQDALQPGKEAPCEPLVENNSSLEGSETILLVDDEEMVRLRARAVLGYRGYALLEAIDGEEALRKLSESQARIDLVLLDLQMPKLNGWETLERLQKMSPQTPVILMSSGPNSEIEGKMARLGDAGVMQKPFDNIGLLRQVRRTLDRARKDETGS